MHYYIHYYPPCPATGPEITATLPPGHTPPPPIPTPAPHVAPVTLSSLPPTGSYMTCNHGWTNVMNSDNPEGVNKGDIESYASLRTTAIFCDISNIIAIECVDLSTGKLSQDSGQILTCNKQIGLACLDSDQSGGVCFDYGVRFYCDCKNSSKCLKC